MSKSWQRTLALIAASFLAMPSAFACSACYGEPDAPMSSGLTWAIVVLVGFVGMVLAGVTGFFVHMNRRARTIGPAAPISTPTPLRS
jgi:hypothetical protein